MIIKLMSGVQMRMATLLLLVTGSMWLAGCLIFPANSYQTGSRHSIASQTQTNLQVGVTTKEDVLLMLGEPDYATNNEQLLVYQWAKVKAVWVAYAVVAPIIFGGGTVERHCLLEVSFDASNRVSQTRLVQYWKKGN